MQKIEHLTGRWKPFVFDLEFIGDVRNLNTCKIWEISVYAAASGNRFSHVVDPDPSMAIFPKPPIPEIPQLSRAFLEANHARTWDIVFKELVQWIAHETSNHTFIPVFISHNTHRADKPIMEFEAHRYQLMVPFEYYFFDSLHYCRHMLRQMSGNYSLTGVYQALFHHPFENAHRAQADVDACTKILDHLSTQTWMFTGPIYPAYATSLRTLRWVGRKAEEVLFGRNMTCVEDLILFLQRQIRQAYMKRGQSATPIIESTLRLLLDSSLPDDNITNIIGTVKTLLQDQPFAHSFVLRSQYFLANRA